MRPTTELALARLSWKLWRRDVPWSRRRAIRRDLRANLREAAPDVGEVEAVRRLGSLNALADEYAVANARTPGELSIDGGVAWAVGALAVIVLLNGRRITALSEMRNWGGFDPYSYIVGLPGGIDPLRIFGNVEAGLLLQIQFAQIAYLVVPLVAFVLGLRPWRLLTERRSARSGHRGASTRA